MNELNLNNSCFNFCLSKPMTNKHIEKLEKRDKNNFAKSMLYEDECSKKIQQNDITIDVMKKNLVDFFIPIKLDKGIKKIVSITVKNRKTKSYCRNCILFGLENFGNHSELANNTNEKNGIIR